MIKRLIMNDEGRMVWSAEAITDQRVLEAYLEKLTFIGYNTNSNNTETPEESVERS